MNSKIIFMISLVALSCSHCHQPDKSINLPVDWKFQTGDDPDYSKADFDDLSWKTIQAGRPWEKQGYADYDGFAWYRTRVIIPSALKNPESLISAFRISLGKIDDNDITYVNGKKIGSTNGYDNLRNYLIPYDLIQWDKENSIAVRVEDTGGNGGMYEGPYSIGCPKLYDFVEFQDEDKPKEYISPETLKFNKTIFFRFKYPIEKIDATLKVTIYDMITKNAAFQKEVIINPGTKGDTSYSFQGEIEKPGTYKIEYSLYSKSFTDILNYNTLLFYRSYPRDKEKPESPIVKLAIKGKSGTIPFEDIKLDGYLSERENANLYQRLLNIDEKGILECYYNRPGKQTWVGEYAGKYLHAASRVWRFTKNKQLKAQMDRVVDILLACQNEDGYLGTYLPADYWTEWDVWAHKYNLLGLLSYYSATGYKPALEASVKIGDLLCKTFGDKSNQLRITDHSPHMGMASTSVLEPMTELYRYTGDKKYLDFCYYILKAYDDENGPKIISTLTTVGKVDKTADGKAYEMMSNLTGIVKLYQITGDEKLLKAADMAWNDIANHKLYITGTASERELFPEDFVLPAGNENHIGEGCVTTTWLQYSQALYYLTGESKYPDEIEKSIYNHLLAAENPQTGCVSYYTALQGKKPYRCNIDGHCCLASVPRGIAAIPELAYTKNTDHGFSINLYSGGSFTDSITAKNGTYSSVSCAIDTKFPEEGSVIITMNMSAKSDFRIALRVPSWCKNFKVKVDGHAYNGIQGQYLNMDQTWNQKTTIQISFDLTEQVLDGGKSYPGYIALKVGPQVLAVDQALNPECRDLDKIRMDTPHPLRLSKSLLPEGWVGSQIYSTKATYDGNPVDLKMVPFADAGQTGGDIRVWIKK